jgi:hypothetical protein
MSGRSVFRWIVAVAPLVTLASAPETPTPGGSTAGAGASPQEARARSVDPAYAKTVQEAIGTLPGRLRSFYKAHRAEMPSLGPEPEFPARSPERRFQVDRLAAFPFRELPHREATFKAKYGEQAAEVGRLPWLVQESYHRLLLAMKAKDKQGILRESDLIAGLMVNVRTPVNLSQDFDGQKTGQGGLYVRIADKLPQAMGGKLKLSPDAARYLDEPDDYVFSAIEASYIWLDNVLYLDALAERGKGGYGDIYFEDLARRLGPIVREELSRAAEDAGSYWYTAWTNAGRPVLR